MSSQPFTNQKKVKGLTSHKATVCIHFVSGFSQSTKLAQKNPLFDAPMSTSENLFACFKLNLNNCAIHLTIRHDYARHFAISEMIGSNPALDFMVR